MTSKVGPYRVPFDPGEFLYLIYELGNIVKARLIEIISFFIVGDEPCVEIDDSVMVGTEDHVITEISNNHLKIEKDGIQRVILRKSVIEEDV